MITNCRLIELPIPLGETSAQAARKKPIGHGHISALNIWWRGAPLAACRAAIETECRTL